MNQRTGSDLPNNPTNRVREWKTGESRCPKYALGAKVEMRIRGWLKKYLLDGRRDGVVYL